MYITTCSFFILFFLLDPLIDFKNMSRRYRLVVCYCYCTIFQKRRQEERERKRERERERKKREREKREREKNCIHAYVTCLTYLLLASTTGSMFEVKGIQLFNCFVSICKLSVSV